jgi:hypothetical protein
MQANRYLGVGAKAHCGCKLAAVGTSPEGLNTNNVMIAVAIVLAILTEITLYARINRAPALAYRRGNLGSK